MAGVRGVGVSRLVRQRVVLAVVADPLRDRPLHRHAPEDREHDLHRAVCREAAVGEVAVEADRRPERADDVERDEQHHVDGVDPDAPKEPDRGEQSEWGHDHGDERDDLADRAAAGPHGANLYSFVHGLSQFAQESIELASPASRRRFDEGRSRRQRDLGPRRGVLLARGHDVQVFEQDATARRAHPHRAPRGARPRHGVPRAQRAQLPAPRRASSASSASRRRSPTCRSRSRAPAASSTRAGARSRSPDGRSTRAISSSSGRSDAGCGPRVARSTGWTASSGRSSGISTSARFTQRFRRHFLVPLTAALWSTAPGRALEYPAATAIRFFDNHGMFGFRRFRWRSRRRRQRRLCAEDRRGARDRPAARLRRPFAPA